MSISNKKKIQMRKIPLTKKVFGFIMFCFTILFFPFIFYLTFFANRKKGFTHKTFFREFIRELLDMPRGKYKYGH